MKDNIIEQWPIPKDHCRQTQPLTIIEDMYKTKTNNFKSVLDLGCGEGNSIDIFKKMDSSIDWFGVDIESSPEVNSRLRKGSEFYTFDGVHLPFEMDFFDLIYSNQVFEHVRYPEKLLKEVCRVMKPKGVFIGSTSQLEPYHSFSFWNYTPYGFKCLLEEAGLELLEVRPGIDALTMLIRTGLGRPSFFSRWWRYESPLNRLIDLVGFLMKKNNKEINLAKLKFCCQFTFLAQKC